MNSPFAAYQDSLFSRVFCPSRKYEAPMPNRSRWLLACILAPLFTSAVYSQTPQAVPNEPDCSQLKAGALGLRTAKSGLYYDLVGQAIASGFNKQENEKKLKIQAICSRGSAENIQNLS